jgi:hypothetical protein
VAEARERGGVKPRRGSVVDGKKRCGRCRRTKLVEAFTKAKNKKGGIHAYCKKCNIKRLGALRTKAKTRASHVRYKLRHPDRFRAARIISAFKARGDVLPEGFDRDSIIAMMHAGLACPYCFIALGPINLSIDHKDGRNSEIHPVCMQCNLLKNIMWHEDFLRVRDLLGLERFRFYRDQVKLPWSNRSERRLIA